MPRASPADAANWMQALPAGEYLRVGLLVSAALGALATLVAIAGRAVLVADRALDVWERGRGTQSSQRTW